MSLGFDPDANAAPDSTWDTTFLSDRDVSSQVPINFVPHPGVYVTSACFGNNIFLDDDAATCLSNLLSSQIRRYVIDIYWDTTNRRFSLCPVEIPNSSSNVSRRAIADGISQDTPTVLGVVYDRQVSSSLTSNTTTSSLSTSLSSTSTAPTGAYSVISTNGGSQFLQLGPYQCSSTLTLNSITSIFNDYFMDTSNTLEAKIVTWILNLHVAATWEAPTSPRSSLSSEQLPKAGEFVSDYLSTVSEALYTPQSLSQDRSNLNNSWYHRVTPSDKPLPAYYHITVRSDGTYETDDGWPDENYIQVDRGKRMLVGFGSIDAGLMNYSTTNDLTSIYPPNYISAPRLVSYNADGTLGSGCFYDAQKFTIDELNNSWAVASINTLNPPDLNYTADNLTTCGISQLLNVTIAGMTADDSPEPYQIYGNQAVFSWAYGEPQNESSTGVSNNSKFRCALMVSNEDYQGHWRVEFCSAKYRVACREGHSPYLWSISGFTVPFGSGTAACTGNTTFDVPRTGLENRHLWEKIKHDAQDDPGLLDGVWINFNSLAVQDCWITTGVNGSCPYYQNADAVHSRQILIPTIAALIVLILTGLTILVKCSANARDSRKRRRGDGGWDYEGVPS